MAAVCRHDVTGTGSPGAPDVEAEHEHLGTKPVSDLVDEGGTRDRGAIDAHLVCAAREQSGDVVGTAHSPADGQRDKDLLGRCADDIEHRGAVIDGGLDVEKSDFIGTLLVVLSGEFDGIAGVAKVQEVDALDHPARGDIEAGNDPHCDGHDQILAACIELTRMARAPSS